MRRIIEETLVSLDGVIEDPAQWVGDYFDDAFVKATFERLVMRDAMLMGRRTYEVLAKDWAAQTGDYADVIDGIRKYVFRRPWKRLLGAIRPSSAARWRPA
jgi:dihydrofolate reductase